MTNEIPSTTGTMARRILWTVLPLALYRLLFELILPTVDPSAVERASDGVGQFNVALLGIWPFVTGALLVELFVWIVPSGQRLRAGGVAARQRIDQWAIYFGLGFCLAQGYALAIWLERQEVIGGGSVVAEPGTMTRLVTVITLTGGSVACLLLARWITRFGLGNGIALLMAWPVASRVIGALGLTIPGTAPSQPTADAVQLLTLVAVSVVASVILLASPRTFAALDERGHSLEVELPALPQTLSAATLASSLLFIPSSLGPVLGMDAALVNRLFPQGWSYTIGSAILILVLSVPLARWIFGRRRVERELAPRFALEDGFDATLRRQLWPAIGFLVIGEIVFSLPPLIAGPLPSLPMLSFTSIVLAVAVALDLIAHARFVRRHGSSAAVARLDNVALAAALASSLEADGIPTVIQGYRPRSLSALFAPLIKMRILVPVEHEENARRKVAIDQLSVI